MLRRTTLAALAMMLPVSATAQDGRPTLLDLLTPDRIIRSMLQSGILSLRTVADVKYGEMSVDFAAGQATLTDVQVWPLPDWDGGADCMIEIDRLALRTAALDEVDRLRLKLQASGAVIPPECLPEEPREVFGLLDLERLVLPRLAVDIDYDIPSSGADITVFTTVQDVASAELRIETSYVWFDGREDMDDPEPVVFLDHAALSVENLGGWAAVQSLLPPQLSNPASASLMLEGLIGGMMAEANRDAGGSGGDPSALSDAQERFLASLTSAWPAFLAAPERLVIETGFEGDTYIDFEALEDSPIAAFDTFQPVVGVAPTRHADVLPTALLGAALSGDDLSDTDRRRAGLALVSGSGAPRNIALGVELLRPLAEAGDGDAALAAAEGLAARDPEEAYRLALLAGAAETPGATPLLDRIEETIGLATALSMQNDVEADALPSAEDVAQSFLVRDRAAQKFTGRGATRNYTRAAMWATIGAAAGDAEAESILADIDARMEWETGKARTAWQEAEAAAARAATDIWLEADMPGRLGMQQVDTR